MRDIVAKRTTGDVTTAVGTPNIAFIKYWGKRDERLILPHNSSLSMTLSPDALRTTTSVMFSDKLKHDVFYIDGKQQDLNDKDIAERFNMVNQLRAMAKTDQRIIVVSNNDFPAASGLASSASGISTLSYAVNHALGLGLDARELSIIARQGSGSSCRSIYGGIVEWHKGVRPDGSDSYAEQLFDEKYWPDIVDNIVVVSQEKKKVSSRAGMKQTVETNPLYRSRPDSAEKRLSETVAAYKARDFDRLAECIMADSNEMHALMLSTRPSIRYLNPVSYEIMDAIEELNTSQGRNVAAYTFDAGANANIITLKKSQAMLDSALKPIRDSGRVLYTKISQVGPSPKILSGEGHSLIDTKKLAPKSDPASG